MTPHSRAAFASTLLDARLDALRSRLYGDLLMAGDPGYDEARLVQDITVDRRPLAIVRAAGPHDVALAVDVAREHGLTLTVRSGGHSLAQHSMTDDSLVIDVSQMKGISIDPQTRIARVQSGVTSGDLAGPAAELGLALTTGDTASVGFGGLATGGGIGFMVRKYGLTIDSLLSAQVVTASGEIVTASAESHPDLFWAIRGGGGNFGIITEFTFQLAEVPQILGGDLILPATREVLRGYLEYASTAPDGLSTIGNLIVVPPMPEMPEFLVGKTVLGIIAVWTGDMAEGEAAVAPLRALAEPYVDALRPMPYPEIYHSTAHQEMRHGVSMRSMFANELSDETLDAYLEGIENSPSPFSLIHLRGLGGAMNRVDPDATAFAHRDKRYMVALIGAWLDEDVDPEPVRNWVQGLWQACRHEGEGVYVNFLENEGPDRLGDAYPVETLGRLAAVKRKYDPQNLFSRNQNIKPAS